MPSSKFERIKRTIKEVKRQQQRNSSSVYNTSSDASHVAISEMTEDNAVEEDIPTSPVARFSSKRVIRGIKNRARGLSKSDRLESSLNLFAVSNKPGFSTHFNLTYHLRLFGERKEKAKEKIIENQLQLQVLIEHDVFRNRQALQHLSIFLSG